MSIIAKITQTPTERKRYRIDYTDWLSAGVNPADTVSSISFASVPASPTPALVDAFQIETGHLTVAIFISGGVDGATYKILVTMTTADGQIKEDEIQVRVKAL